MLALEPSRHSCRGCPVLPLTAGTAHTVRVTACTALCTASLPQVCDLQDNYRSSARIVATAQSVIAPNDEWQRKGMNPMHPAGDLIQVLVWVGVLRA